MGEEWCYERDGKLGCKIIFQYDQNNNRTEKCMRKSTAGVSRIHVSMTLTTIYIEDVNTKIFEEGGKEFFDRGTIKEYDYYE